MTLVILYEQPLALPPLMLQITNEHPPIQQSRRSQLTNEQSSAVELRKLQLIMRHD